MLRTASRRIELDAPDLVADTERMIATFRSWSPPEVVMVGRRNTRSVNSWTHNVEGLVGGSNRCTFEIHPADAARQGIGDGGTMTVTTEVGTITGTAEVTDRVRPGVISAPFGWGHDLPGSRTPVAAAHAGFNVNEVAPFDVDEPSGNAVLNAIPVSIRAGGS